MRGLFPLGFPTSRGRNRPGRTSARPARPEETPTDAAAGRPATAPPARAMAKPARVPFAVGQPVLVSNPDSPDCFRAGEVGTVVRVHTHETPPDPRRNRPGKVERFYDVAFTTDVVDRSRVDKQGNPLNFGPVGMFAREAELEPADD